MRDDFVLATLRLGAENMSRWRVSNFGFYDVVRGQMHNYLMDHGCGKEDSDMICDMMLAQLMRDLRGERLACFVGRCKLKPAMNDTSGFHA